MHRWSWIAWHQSNTLRALLVALVAWVLNVSGVAEDAAGSSAQSVVDTILHAIEGVGVLWAMYARARQPTPPVTLTKRAADQLNAAESELVEESPREAALHGGESNGTQ